ncbi:MAG: dihydroorotase [Chitinophagales bacterium]|nr:dihydroorotase [Bacteroidota bacterium]MCB9043330.1 dihydroorotase [Chitinophagales bacterium]
MKKILLKNAHIINEGKQYYADVLIKSGFIEKIAPQISNEVVSLEIDASKHYLLPGVIDDQVHFRQPGLTYKANIYTESKAAVAGGVTSFMEMPNTNPPTLSQKLLQEKYDAAQVTSLANFSFYMGASNDNLEEVLRTDPTSVCGIKAFLGSSTGNMLLDNDTSLEKLFSTCPMLIAVHCEDEQTIRDNTAHFKQQYQDKEVTAALHPLIRTEEACFLSSSKAVALAQKHGTRLHVLHISTAKELALFNHTLPLAQKKITAEVCVHHLWFSADDYENWGNFIKCNPAIKETNNRKALWNALQNNTLDVIATDHAPHTLSEKQQSYFDAPSGIPLVQHSLLMMLEAVNKGLISIEQVVQKMAHAPATAFKVARRGYIKEGFYADLVLVAKNKPYTVDKKNILYKCKWSPLEGTIFAHSISHTFVNGNLVFYKGNFDESVNGHRMRFLAD